MQVPSGITHNQLLFTINQLPTETHEKKAKQGQFKQTKKKQQIKSVTANKASMIAPAKLQLQLAQASSGHSDISGVASQKLLVCV